MDQMQFGEIGETPWRITRWRLSGPFLSARIHPPSCRQNIRCKKTIQPDGLTSRRTARKVISPSGFIGMLLQHFSYICCMLARLPSRSYLRTHFPKFSRLNLRISFPKFFRARVFAGNLGVEPSERFHICSNIGNPPASLLFSNGFHVSGVSHLKFKKYFLDKIIL